MRMNTLEKIYLALRDLAPRIEMSEVLRDRAAQADRPHAVPVLMALRVSRPAALALLRGHPWVYRDAILRVPSGLLHGDGRGASGRSRRLSRPRAFRCRRALRGSRLLPEKGPPLDAYALGEAVILRLERRDGRFGEETNAYRLCNGEGDRVPGFVMDCYATWPLFDWIPTRGDRTFGAPVAA